MSHLSLQTLNELIVEAAVCQLAVEDFEVIAGEDNVQALSDLKLELDTARIKLVNHVLSNGAILRLLILSEQAARCVEAQQGLIDVTDLSAEEFIKRLAGK
jgi:hypothetical protein